MRRLPPLAIALLLLAVAPAAASAQTRLAELQGQWGGTLAGTDEPIDVVVRLSGGQRGSTIAFTGGIDCSGLLIYGGRRGERFTFTERITKSATRRCGGLGVVRLRLRSDETLLYRWEPLVGDFDPSYSVLRRLVLAT